MTNCQEKDYDYEYWTGYPPELVVLILLTCAVIIFANIKVFACIPSKDRPGIVTVVWVMADFTMIFGMYSEISWKPGGYIKQTTIT